MTANGLTGAGSDRSAENGLIEEGSFIRVLQIGSP